jgi:hypothetical protein
VDSKLFVFSTVHRDRRHHHHGCGVQRAGDPQHLDVPAQDEDRQLPPHQEPLHRRPHRRLRRSSSAITSDGERCLGFWTGHV